MKKFLMIALLALGVSSCEKDTLCLLEGRKITWNVEVDNQGAMQVVEFFTIHHPPSTFEQDSSKSYQIAIDSDTEPVEITGNEIICLD